MNNCKIVFNSKKTDEFDYNPPKELKSFYQICRFKNPFTNKYATRKIIFNELGEIVKKYEKEYSKQRIEMFAKTQRQNKYCMYPASDINLIDLPSPSFILEAKSELLNNDYEEYGYAKF